MALKHIMAYGAAVLTAGGLAYVSEAGNVPPSQRNLNQPIVRAIGQDLEGIATNVAEKGPMLTRIVADPEIRNKVFKEGQPVGPVCGAGGEAALLALLAYAGISCVPRKKYDLVKSD